MSYVALAIDHSTVLTSRVPSVHLKPALGVAVATYPPALTAVLPDNEIALFDPYEDDPDFKEPGRRIIPGEPKKYNRAVRYDLLNLQDESDYAMGPLPKREVLLIWRQEAEPKAEIR